MSDHLLTDQQPDGEALATLFRSGQDGDGAMSEGSSTAATEQLATIQPAGAEPGAAGGAPPGTETGAAANSATDGLPANVAVPIRASRELQQLSAALLESHGSQFASRRLKYVFFQRICAPCR